MNKEALHQHDRGLERLNLSPENVNAIQRAVDRMWFTEGHRKLTGTNYYSHIRDPRRNLLGYAAFQRVNDTGRKPRLILATILSKHMKPKGGNISHFFDIPIKDNGVEFSVPQPYKGMAPIPNMKTPGLKSK